MEKKLRTKSMEECTRESIAREFPVDQQASVLDLLGRYTGPEPARVVWDILVLSKGSLENVQKYVDAARMDYRDVLYWAEYFKNDPLFKGRDPKKLVREVINNWGTKE